MAEITGFKGKHLGDRQAFRRGTEKGSVVLGGRKTAIRQPSVRAENRQESVQNPQGLPGRN